LALSANWMSPVASPSSWDDAKARLDAPEAAAY
jgi:hypothetical protein